MKQISRDEYLTTRVEEQITWMEGRAAFNQKRHKRFKRAEIIIAASVPLSIGFSDYARTFFSVFAAVAASVLLIMISIQQMNKYYETWINYRATIEKLKREKFLFLSEAGIYSIEETDAAKKEIEEEKRFKIFVETIENILSVENENWKNIDRQKPANG
jgi:hypothetical protein